MRKLMEPTSRTDTLVVRLRSLIALSALGAAVALSSFGALGAAQDALASSGATREQVAWIRRAASNFVGDELRRDSAGVCSILAARLRATRHHRTCTERWSARLARLLREPRARAALRADAHAIPAAAVMVHGDSASIELPAPLISGPNRLRWTENCWMVEG